MEVCVTFVISIAGLDAKGDGDKKHQNAVLTELQESSPAVLVSDQTDMNSLALDHSEYESMHETTQTGNRKHLFFALGLDMFENQTFPQNWPHKPPYRNYCKFWMQLVSVY